VSDGGRTPAGHAGVRRLAEKLATATSTWASQNHAISEPAWRAYEGQIVDLVRSRATPGTEIATNVHVPGLISGVKRQVDVLVKAVSPESLMHSWCSTASAMQGRST
jgi:hypothetical protein